MKDFTKYLKVLAVYATGTASSSTLSYSSTEILRCERRGGDVGHGGLGHSCRLARHIGYLLVFERQTGLKKAPQLTPAMHRNPADRGPRGA